MNVNGITGANAQIRQMGMSPAADSYSRNLQKQIANAQKQLQEISSNKNMSLEEKMKKREEMQKEINDLNTQLRQYQMEQRREKQQTKEISMDDMTGGTKNTGNRKSGDKGSGISQAGMTAMISADSSKKQAKVQGSVATNLNGTAKVLKSEIETDKKRGIDTQKQEEDLAKLEQNALKATASQMHTLSEANKNLEEAAKEEGRTDKTDRREEGSDNGDVETVGAEENVAAEKISTRQTESAAATYASVNICI